jgi:uncharacterized cupredoxin-like copper-binding protein
MTPQIRRYASAPGATQRHATHSHRSTMKTLRAAFTVAVLAITGSVHAGGNATDGHAHGPGDAIGVPGTAGRVSRTVQVDMSDTMRFNPASVSVKQGETIRFVVKNSGRLKHEFVLGNEGELKEHHELMKKFPDMEHADPNMVTVASGKTGEVIWQFTKAGTVDFACLQPGHYDAGMKGVVSVSAGQGGTKGASKGDDHPEHKH